MAWLCAIWSFVVAEVSDVTASVVIISVTPLGAIW
jgi:hypothetical protein